MGRLDTRLRLAPARVAAQNPVPRCLPDPLVERVPRRHVLEHLGAYRPTPTRRPDHDFSDLAARDLRIRTEVGPALRVARFSGSATIVPGDGPVQRQRLNVT